MSRYLYIPHTGCNFESVSVVLIRPEQIFCAHAIVSPVPFSAPAQNKNHDSLPRGVVCCSALIRSESLPPGSPAHLLQFGPRTDWPARMPRGESLRDELQQADEEYEPTDDARNRGGDAADSNGGGAARVADSPPLLSAAPVPPSAAAHTPLAKYLTRINKGEEGEQAEAEADTREPTEEAADDHIEDEGDASAEAEAEAEAEADASAPSPSAAPRSTPLASLLVSLALEIISPALCSCILPHATLAARSKQWCIEMLLTTATGLESASLGPSNQRVMHAQISSQLSRIRKIYLASIVVALLQSSFFGLLLLWQGMQQMGFGLILPLLLGSPPVSHGTMPEAAGALWLFVCLLLFALGLLNLLAALGNLRSSTSWHSLLVSAGGCVSPVEGLGMFARFEAQTKVMILQLMERELVKRGYQLSGRPSNSQRTPAQPQGFVPIERMDAASLRSGTGGGGGVGSQQQEEDGSTRIRSALRDMFQQQSRQFLCMQHQIQRISAELDALVPASGFNADVAVPIPDVVASSSLPSIVQLKSMRSEWMHGRSVLVAAFLALLGRLRQAWVPAPLLPSPLRGHLSIETQLARAFLQLRIALSGHLATMACLSSPAPAPQAAATSAPGAEAELPASRRALQQSLGDVHASIRSADRRLQIALERQEAHRLPMKSAAAGDAEAASAAALSAATKLPPGRGLLDHIRSELFPPQLLPASSEADPSPPASAASAASTVVPWTSEVSSSFSQDIAYLRTLLVQLHRHCDTLDGALKNADADAGLDPQGSAQKLPAPGAETIVSQNADNDANSSSSASAADASQSHPDLLAALLSMRQKKAQAPAGMGAVFEGSGAFTEPSFRPRPRAAPAASSAAPPAVSIFTILSELKSVLHSRPQAYEYVVHNREVTAHVPVPASASAQMEERKASADDGGR